jgi:NAD+ kinase
LVVTEPNEGTTLVVDGRVVGRMTADDRVRIERAAAQFQLVEVPGQTYYRTLRTKLGWGGRIGGV